MDSVLSKLFLGDKEKACEAILSEYHRKGNTIVNYLYFANVTGKKLFDTYHQEVDESEFAEAVREDYKIMSPKTIGAAYKKALLESDFLLPDGIALQLFYWIASKLKKIKTTMPRLPNLNGTDFGLAFLQHIQERFGKDELQIILYGTYPGILEKTKEVLTDKGFEILYAQDGYTNFDREQVEQLLTTNRKKYTVLLVARTTPEYPIQELWARANKDLIKKNKLLVLNQWGTFDFWAGVQKRAPKLWRKYKLERLWRRISDPKRNTKKIKDSLKIINYIFRYLLLKNK